MFKYYYNNIISNDSIITKNDKNSDYMNINDVESEFLKCIHYNFDNNISDNIKCIFININGQKIYKIYNVNIL